MKISDVADTISIDPRKLTHYALDKRSPTGKHKAVVFEKVLGFTKENHAPLIHQIETKALQSEATFHSEDRHGKRYTVDIAVDGVSDRKAIVRTGWIIPAETRAAHLTTLRVLKDRSK